MIQKVWIVHLNTIGIMSLFKQNKTRMYELLFAMISCHKSKHMCAKIVAESLLPFLHYCFSELQSCYSFDLGVTKRSTLVITSLHNNNPFQYKRMILQQMVIKRNILCWYTPFEVKKIHKILYIVSRDKLYISWPFTLEILIKSWL